MLRKLKNTKGYILLESLVGLSLICLLIGSFVSLNTFLLRKNQEGAQRLQLSRVMYEEMKYYEQHGTFSEQTISRDQQTYRLQIQKTKDKLTEVRMTDGKETIVLKKE
ncbi:competence type IV pilus minor pilin ComGE [Enterococcus sp. UD-01]|jgi:type II secretory pathway pseudopilin PulG|uniref:competence type IV pilus minor pilin ComGE n=1 Tax=Enterococcus sp. UD-01 TaxID=3373911 RepID=UPI003835AAA4